MEYTRRAAEIAKCIRVVCVRRAIYDGGGGSQDVLTCWLNLGAMEYSLRGYGEMEIGWWEGDAEYVG